MPLSDVQPDTQISPCDSLLRAVYIEKHSPGQCEVLHGGRRPAPLPASAHCHDLAAGALSCHSGTAGLHAQDRFAALFTIHAKHDMGRSVSIKAYQTSHVARSMPMTAYEVSDTDQQRGQRALHWTTQNCTGQVTGQRWES